jgi:hypothetical protein
MVNPVGIPHRTLTVCGGTNIGATRKKNQDTFVIAELDSGRVSRPCLRTDVDSLVMLMGTGDLRG